MEPLVVTITVGDHSPIVIEISGDEDGGYTATARILEGLGDRQMSIFEELKRVYPESLTVDQLAKRIVYSPANTHNAVQGLIKRGLVECGGRRPKVYKYIP
jgi:predicted transcriptional regulator